MRNANLIVVMLGIAGLALAAALAWRWQRLALLADTRTVADTRGRAALDGLRTLAVAMAAGVLAGVLVPGLGGRLVMRILGSTSHDAQGERTAANEVVGTITSDGTIAVVVFVGVLGGVIAALAFVVVRRWLPTTAGPAGWVAGVLLLGTIGVSDAMSPDNKDFAILRPTWLAVTLVVALALLFGVTFTGLAARLDAGMPMLTARPSSIASHSALIIYLIPFLLVGAVVYVALRALLLGRLTAILASARVQRVGRVIVGIATLVATASSFRAIDDIMSA